MQGRWVKLSSRDLLPGDLASVGVTKAATSGLGAMATPDKAGGGGGGSGGVVCPADVLLLKGTCVVNEAMLTGESVPLLKEGLEAMAESDGADALEAFEGSSKCHTGHVVFGGTQVRCATA